MSVMQIEENTLGIAKFPIIQLHAFVHAFVAKLLNFMIVIFNVLKLCPYGNPQH